VELDGDTRPVDLRILAASAADLKDLIAQDRFRLDLFYRLAAVELTLPPLREISADIPLLFTHFVAEAAARHGLPEPEITFADRKALLRHHCPVTRMSSASLRSAASSASTPAPAARAPPASAR
jgi:two-component system C4-dicarboxylate transport response regulator DctD